MSKPSFVCVTYIRTTPELRTSHGWPLVLSALKSFLETGKSTLI